MIKDAHRELAKWLNEEQIKPVDRVALATVLAELDEIKLQRDLARERMREQDLRIKELDKLKALVTATHKAKGRYHSQSSMCDLYDACGLANVRPGGVLDTAILAVVKRKYQL